MTTPHESTRVTTGLTWLTRLAWIGLAVVAPDPIEDWLGGVDAPEWATSLVWIAAIVLWLIGVAALVFPSVATLTLARTTVPLATAATAAVAIAGPSPWSVAATGLAAATAVGVSSADFGRRYAQASAYGHEERFLLRPPPIYLALCVLVWGVAATTTLAAIALVVRLPLVALIAAVVAVVSWPWGWRRWHRLSRRWAVIVPAGLVLHDHVVLAETAMIPRATLATIGVADEPGEAYDLTGGTRGPTVTFTTRSSLTVLLAASPNRPAGTAIHLTAAMIAPSRPGRFIGRMQRASGPRSTT